MKEKNSKSNIPIKVAIITAIGGWVTAAIAIIPDILPPAVEQEISTEPPAIEQNKQTCWHVEFGLNDLDWAMNIRVPSRAGCYMRKTDHDSWDGVGLCDARFTGQKLRINMTKLTTFKDGARYEAPVVNMEAEGTEEAEVISGMHLTYEHQRPWKARKIDCSELVI